jgi:hypothetical protein
MPRSRRRFVLCAAVVAAASLIGTGPSSAATLAATEECRFLPGAFECGSFHVIRYVAGGGERNRVVVSADLTRAAVSVYDPGIPLAAGPLETPELTDPVTPTSEIDLLPVTPTWSCAAPTGKSLGLCWTTPGRECPPFIRGCFTNLATFSFVQVRTDDRSDSVRLLRGTPRGELETGAGDDKVDAHNGADDRIDCGDGFDTVAAEVRDTVDATCEAVTRGVA